MLTEEPDGGNLLVRIWGGPRDRQPRLLDDAVEADQVFSDLMGDEVEPRREFIEKSALDVIHLDI